MSHAPPPPSTSLRTGRQAAIIALLAWTQLVTIARTVRWPNDFAEAHWLLDYRFGIVRRGLAGQVLSWALWPFGAEPTEVLVASLTGLVFVALSVVVLMLALRVVQNANWSPSSVLVALAFVSSPFVVMSAHLVGYFDHLLFLAAVAAVVLVGCGRVWSAGAVLALAVFVHESAVVFGFPILVVAWIARRDQARATGQPVAPVWPLALPLVAFGCLALSPGFLLSPDFQDAFARRLETFTFVGGDMHLLVPEWLAPAGLGALTAQSHRFVERAVFAEAYGLVLPATLALVAYLVDRHGRASSLAGRLAVAGAIFAPVVMHLAAWDTIRIWTYSIGTAFLVVWVYSRGALPVGRVSAAANVTALVALAVNVLVMTPLLDGLADRLSLVTRLALYAPSMVAAVALAGEASRRRTRPEHEASGSAGVRA